MQIKIVNDADGCPAVQVIDSETEEVFQSIELAREQQVVINVPEVEDLSTIEVGTVEAATPESSAAETSAGTAAGAGGATPVDPTDPDDPAPAAA
jgi:hypothetical protein